MAETAASLSRGLHEYRARYTALQNEVNQLVLPLTPSQLNRKPAPGHWSVGQCIDHLMLAGSPLADNMEKAIDKARGKERLHGSEPPRHGLFGRLFLYLLQPSVPFGMASPTMYQPSEKNLDPAQVAADFSRLQERFVACIDRTADLDINRIRMPSPVTPLVRFRMSTWLQATINHEERHVAQARRTFQKVGIDLP